MIKYFKIIFLANQLIIINNMPSIKLFVIKKHDIVYITHI